MQQLEFQDECNRASKISEFKSFVECIRTLSDNFNEFGSCLQTVVLLQITNNCFIFLRRLQVIFGKNGTNFSVYGYCDTKSKVATTSIRASISECCKN